MSRVSRSTRPTTHPSPKVGWRRRSLSPQGRGAAFGAGAGGVPGAIGSESPTCAGWYPRPSPRRTGCRRPGASSRRSPPPPAPRRRSVPLWRKGCPAPEGPAPGPGSGPRVSPRPPPRAVYGPGGATRRSPPPQHPGPHRRSRGSARCACPVWTAPPRKACPRGCGYGRSTGPPPAQGGGRSGKSARACSGWPRERSGRTARPYTRGANRARYAHHCESSPTALSWARVPISCRRSSTCTRFIVLKLVDQQVVQPVRNPLQGVRIRPHEGPTGSATWSAKKRTPAFIRASSKRRYARGK